MAMMRRIKSETPRDRSLRDRPARTSLNQRKSDARKSDAFSAVKNLIGRNRSSAKFNGQPDDALDFLGNGFHDEKDHDRHDHARSSSSGCHDSDNYAPKAFQTEDSSKSPDGLAPRSSVSAKKLSGNSSSDDAFNEDLSVELASLRERIVSSHFQSVEFLVKETNRLRTELANAGNRRLSAHHGRAKARSVTYDGQEPKSPGSGSGSLRPDASWDLSRSPHRSDTASSQKPEWSSENPRKKVSLNISVPKTQDQSGLPSEPRSPLLLVPTMTSNEEEANSVIVGAITNSLTDQVMEADYKLETDSYTMHGFSSLNTADDLLEVKSGDEIKPEPPLLKEPPSPYGGSPEPPSSPPSALPCNAADFPMGESPCALPCTHEGDSSIEIGEHGDLETVAPTAAVGFASEADSKPDNNGNENEQHVSYDSRDGESSEDSDSGESEATPEEKFELWGIWLRTKNTAATRRQTRANVDEFGGLTASSTFATFADTNLRNSGEVAGRRGSLGFLPLVSLPVGVDSLETEEDGGGAVRWRTCRRWLRSRLMLTPSSLKHILWECLALLFIVFDAILIPLKTFDIPRSSILTASAVVLCSFRLLDLVKNFLTGYIRLEGTIELDPVKVAQRYIKSWLILDVACTTCDWISLFMVDAPAPLEIARMFRMLRLVTLAPEIENLVTEHMMSLGNADIVNLISSVVKSIIALLAVTHVIACAWYAFGEIASEYSGIGWVRQNHLETAMLWERYAWSLHWSLGQFVGEYIFMPTGSLERSFALFVLLFALLFSALFVSSITTAMTRLQILAGKQASQMAVLRRYLSDNNISASLTVRVLRNAEHSCHSSKKNVPEKRVDMLNNVSEPLRVELHYEVHFPILAVHPWFDRYQLVNPAGLRKVCHVAVKMQTVHKGDVIFSDCETPVWPRTFFFVSGSFKYQHEMFAERTLKCGDWACEAVLWTRWMHCGTLTSGQDSVLASLDAEKFTSIVSPFPTDHASLYGHNFVSDLNSVSREFVSDLASERTEDLVWAAFNKINSTSRGNFRGSGPPMTKTGSKASLKFRTSAFGHMLSSRSSVSKQVSRETSSTRRLSRVSVMSRNSLSPVRKLKSNSHIDLNGFS